MAALEFALLAPAFVMHVFNAKFGFVTDTLFNDPTIPAGYAPFNIANMGGKLIVTFAAQKPPDNHDDQAGAGFGFVDVFTARGEFVRRLASGGTLNAPWGLARAGDNMGMFSDALLVSNFGDGKINAFDAAGNFLGQLPDTSGNPLSIDGLWGIASVNAESDHGESRAALYFAAGPNEEGDGLFGFLAPVKSRGGFHAHR